MRSGEGRGNAGLIDEDDAEARADDCFGREEISEADARGDIVIVKLAGAAAVAVDAEVVELLRGEVEDRALVVLLDRGEVKGPARADVGGEAVGDFPVVLDEILLDLVARPNLAFLQVDLEGIDLAEEEAGDGVAAVGDALLIGSSGGEGKGAGGIGRGNGVELIPAEVAAELECVRAAGEDEAVDKPARRRSGSCENVLAEGPSCWNPVKVKRGRALLNAALVGMPGMPSAVDAVLPRCCADDGVAAASVAEAEVVEQPSGEGVGFVEDGLLAENV